jgi:arylsulfatase A-like enzyme
MHTLTHETPITTPQTRHADGGRCDRRTFLGTGVRVGGALAFAALGLDGVLAPVTSAAVRPHVPPSHGVRPPNILVVMVDQLRAPCWFGAGPAGAVALPATVAALAKRGVSFARHYTASNDCTPSRAALLTGLHSHQTGCMITGVSSLDPAFPTWGTMLGGLGYDSWWFGKWHLTRSDRWWDTADGPAALRQYGFDGGTFPSPNGSPGQGSAVDGAIADQFDSWFGAGGGDGPWCTTVSFVNPHDIAWWWRATDEVPDEAHAPRVVAGLPANFETPAQLQARHKPRLQRSLQETSADSFGAVPFEGPGVAQAWRPFMDLYVELQRRVDRQIARVLATLASRPAVAANTVVIFTSDHGEYGASHGLRGKGASVYEEAIRVPMIVADNTGRLGLRPGVRRQLTSSVDVAPLLVTLASGSADWRTDPLYSPIAARADLLAIARDPSAAGRAWALHATDEVVTEFARQPYAAHAPAHVTGIVTGEHKYAAYSHWRPGTLEPVAATQERELYDYTTFAGRLEVDNQAGHHRQEERLAALLESATATELRAPLPAALTPTQRQAIERYHALARQEHALSASLRADSAAARGGATPARDATHARGT